LYFLPLPQGQGALRPIFIVRMASRYYRCRLRYHCAQKSVNDKVSYGV
jgi:hypothetical protein